MLTVVGQEPTWHATAGWNPLGLGGLESGSIGTRLTTRNHFDEYWHTTPPGEWANDTTSPLRPVGVLMPWWV